MVPVFKGKTVIGVILWGIALGLEGVIELEVPAVDALDPTLGVIVKIVKPIATWLLGVGVAHKFAKLTAAVNGGAL